MESDTTQAHQPTEENGQPTGPRRKMHYKGKVIKTTLAGAIVDIGLEHPGIVHISRLKAEPVNRVEDVVEVGQEVDVWIRRLDPNTGRIDLTMIEPVDLEWRDLKNGMVVKGKITRLETFGAFVDIGAERPGLVHISEMSSGFIRSPGEVVREGDEVEVKVIGVDRRKKRIRLSMKALQEATEKGPSGPSREPEAPEEPVPTAMEVALREAMDRAKEEEGGEKVTASKGRSPSREELDDILSRTLEQKRE